MAEDSACSLPSTVLELNSQKRYRPTNKDRISGLPDEILCQIISFLPTLHAAATSILSTRWRYLWTLVDNLDVEDRHDGKISELVTGFPNFIEKAFACRGEFIKKFSLKLDECHNYSRLKESIYAAMKSTNLEELSLCLSFSTNMRLLDYIFVSCQKLVVLTLSGRMWLNVPDSVSFSSLKILHLKSLESLSEAHIRKLLSCSPVLEELVIDSNVDERSQPLHIISSSLKKLKICKSRPCFTTNFYTAKIDAPNLEILYIKDQVSKHCSCMNLTSLVKAHLIVATHSHYGRVTVKVLRQISSVRILYLSHYTMWDLHSLPVLNLPLFHHLRHLDVGILCGEHEHVLWDILTNSPNLNSFCLHQAPHVYTSSVWHPPLSVPQCFLKSLEMIELKGYDSFGRCEAYKEVVEYFLKNAMLLKTLAILTQGTIREERSAVLKDLLKVPRASSTCQIVFS